MNRGTMRTISAVRSGNLQQYHVLPRGSAHDLSCGDNGSILSTKEASAVLLLMAFFKYVPNFVCTLALSSSVNFERKMVSCYNEKLRCWLDTLMRWFPSFGGSPAPKSGNPPGNMSKPVPCKLSPVTSWSWVLETLSLSKSSRLSVPVVLVFTQYSHTVSSYSQSLA